MSALTTAPTLLSSYRSQFCRRMTTKQCLQKLVDVFKCMCSQFKYIAFVSDAFERYVTDFQTVVEKITLTVSYENGWHLFSFTKYPKKMHQFNFQAPKNQKHKIVSAEVGIAVDHSAMKWFHSFAPLGDPNPFDDPVVRTLLRSPRERRRLLS